MSCDHHTQRWVDTSYENWATGEIIEDGYWASVGTYEDIDLHRYRCTLCKAVFYYSSRAKSYFENGTTVKGIVGLDK